MLLSLLVYDLPLLLLLVCMRERERQVCNASNACVFFRFFRVPSLSPSLILSHFCFSTTYRTTLLLTTNQICQINRERERNKLGWTPNEMREMKRTTTTTTKRNRTKREREKQPHRDEKKNTTINMKLVSVSF